MDLINHTACPAELFVTSPTPDTRAGYLVAKVTFSAVVGRLELVSDDPLPILDEELETALGSIPSDLSIRKDGGIDVVLLGAAYAPGGRPIPEMEVRLQVGDRDVRARITGDRGWVGKGANAAITEPVPFTRMPLTWDRAFGGSTEVWLDGSTPLPVQHPANPLGRGFDPGPMVEGLVRTVGAAEGFPRFAQERLLPNVEDPSCPVSNWDDDPMPHCFATHGPQVDGYELARRMQKGDTAVPPQSPGQVAHRALRGCELAPGAPISAHGCVPEGEWSFAWPPLRLRYDYEIGERSGERSMEPFLLVLLPEERRFTVTFRDRFRFRASPEDERSIRLRLES